jgi:ABC-type antimicrobial peptide transport system permease subunit
VLSIFRKPLTQVSIGVALGSVLAGLVMLTEMGGGTISVTGVGLMLVYGFVILGVCMIACVVPTRRALSVEPMEALRVE